MSAFNDFAVDPCVAAQMKICIKIKECLQLKLQIVSKRATKQLAGSGSAVTANIAMRAVMDEHYACLLEELQRAYTLAGETFPSIPTLPTQIDFSAAAATVEPLNTRVNSDPLDYLSPVMTIELDETGTPTFIRCP